MSMTRAIEAELLKCKSASTVRSSFVAFAIAPVMGAIFVFLARNPDSISKTSAIHTKMQMLGFSADWMSYSSLLMQSVGVGGILLFGFTASWIFGREYSEGTAKDLLALPTSRTTILNAKFIVYLSWCILLSVSNLVAALVLGSLLDLPVPKLMNIPQTILYYFLTTIMTALLGTVISFLAIWGKGYLAPLGFVGLTLVFSQVIAAVGYGNYFPWAVPGLFSGSGGKYGDFLNEFSYASVLLTGLLGYFATIFYWKHADHYK
jgi:ABC-type transport system involved in multi-copper enzyme maturation permease subunit